VDVFLETERLRLRRFTMDDVDNVVALDGDPAVMRYISGGLPTPRDEIETHILPAWLSYYARLAGYGFWAAHDRSSDEFLGWSTSAHHPDMNPTTWSLAIACARRRGARATRPKGRGR
jgi:RimJ/RimL family protein N-acetyltransferase